MAKLMKKVIKREATAESQKILPLEPRPALKDASIDQELTMLVTGELGGKVIHFLKERSRAYWTNSLSEEKYPIDSPRGRQLALYTNLKILSNYAVVLSTLENKLGEPDGLKNLEQAKKDIEAIRDAANIVEKSKINFAQICQDAETAGSEAISDIESIAEKADKRIEISTLYVEAFNNVGIKDYKFAFNIYKQILTIDNNQPRALEGIAYIFEQQGLTEKADKYRKLAAELEAQGAE
jgi:hypothetical protein